MQVNYFLNKIRLNERFIVVPVCLLSTSYSLRLGSTGKELSPSLSISAVSYAIPSLVFVFLSRFDVLRRMWNSIVSVPAWPLSFHLFCTAFVRQTVLLYSSNSHALPLLRVEDPLRCGIDIKGSNSASIDTRLSNYYCILGESIFHLRDPGVLIIEIPAWKQSRFLR